MIFGDKVDQLLDHRKQRALQVVPGAHLVQDHPPSCSQVGLIPVRYPGSESKKWDAPVRLSRRTQFVDDGAGGEVPVGQRMLATDAGEFSLLDVRSVRLGTDDLNPLGPEKPGTIGQGVDSLIPGLAAKGGKGGGGDV